MNLAWLYYWWKRMEREAVKDMIIVIELVFVFWIFQNVDILKGFAAQVVVFVRVGGLSCQPKSGGTTFPRC